ncbi:MAG: hypothetical protein ACPGU1_22420 [Myxococcota bacterium]
MRADVLGVWLFALMVTSCGQPTTDKVARRATVVEMPGPVAEEPVSVEAPEEVVSKAPVPVAPRREPSCERLIKRACEALGEHSDECQEARSLIKGPVTPEQHSGCFSILETHVLPNRSGKRTRRLNPCRRLIRAVCRASKASTWACKQTRADASRLWRTGNGEACLGDLLLVEARGVLSVRRPVD